MKVKWKINHKNIYLFGLTLLIVSLPLSIFLMSFSGLLLLFNWLVEGKLDNKFRVFLKNKTALVISSLFILHIIGLFYTSDFAYAFLDLKIKIPLLFTPLIISTSEKFTEKAFRNLLLIFIAAVVISTIAGMYNFFTMDIIDIRDISTFISHIRLSLLICLAIFILFYFIVRIKDYSRIQKMFFCLIIFWLVTFLIILESLTGLSILFIIGLILLIVAVFRIKKNLYKAGLLAIFVAFPFIIFIYVRNIYNEFILSTPDEKSKLEKFTAQRNPYIHDTLSDDIENGHYVWRYICEPEMKEAWNKRSVINYEDKDQKNRMIKYTLIRFLTSKGYRKDAEGVNQLNLKEINSIEKGITNVNCQNEYSLRTRIYETISEYENYKLSKNPNNYSLMQRFEYWKTSLEIIKDNLLFGVGTGDMNVAFSQQYEKMNSPLEKKWRLRSHNQFLSITVGFGLFGLIWFLFTLIYPFFTKCTRRDYYYLVFFAIAMISMLTEDTIESQAGLTFFAFFNSLFLFGRKKEN